MRNVDYVEADLSFRASPASVCFLVHARDVTAAYEAALMQNFTACNVGFFMYAQKAVREQGKDGGGENETQCELCMCVSGGEGVYSLWTKSTVIIKYKGLEDLFLPSFVNNISGIQWWFILFVYYLVFH